ncbi:PspC family transcriptional regulator [Salinibacterium xinjiangense]|uniref:Phage shock protein C (PspC) family protein n=1 Tax=Salinibacterium xinjiangense TaxID=386302 RepID=A0A2C8ZXF8_9MICO|nr:PspC family transcriptional regulator [Salinibacterium xinjiangense]SOE70701.1 phage shock protein C (PspC) family protein [Salinibacterium xinjiangense]
MRRWGVQGRPRDGRVIAGVCAGVARRFDITAYTVRVITLLAVLFGGLNVSVYVVLWIVIPSDDY